MKEKKPITTKTKRKYQINREDIYYWFILFALVLIGYFVYIVVAPTFEIVRDTNSIINQMDKQTNLTIEQNEKIIENQNNNTEAIQNLIIENRANQEEAVNYLISIANQSNKIGNHTADLILSNLEELQELQKNITETAMIRTAAYHPFQEQEAKGKISGFLGGPVITNESIPDFYNNQTNRTLNFSK